MMFFQKAPDAETPGKLEENRGASTANAAPQIGATQAQEEKSPSL